MYQFGGLPALVSFRRYVKRSIRRTSSVRSLMRFCSLARVFNRKRTHSWISSRTCRSSQAMIRSLSSFSDPAPLPSPTAGFPFPLASAQSGSSALFNSSTAGAPASPASARATVLLSAAARRSGPEDPVRSAEVDSAAVSGAGLVADTMTPPSTARPVGRREVRETVRGERAGALIDAWRARAGWSGGVDSVRAGVTAARSSAHGRSRMGGRVRPSSTLNAFRGIAPRPLL